MATTVVTSQQITDDLVKKINQEKQTEFKSEDVLEGTVVDDASTAQPPASGESPKSYSPERELRSRIESGEWDNLHDLEAFKIRTPEGQLMARTEAIDYRIHQLEQRLPMLLNQYLHDSYIQVLKEIYALRKTKASLFYIFYKNNGTRDLADGQ